MAHFDYHKFKLTFRNFKYTGLAALFIEYTTVAYFVFIIRQQLMLSQTISDFGTFNQTQVAFSAAFSVAGILFGLFGLWLYQKLKLHRNFLITLYVCIVADLILLQFPAIGKTILVHYIATTIMIIALPVLVYYYALDHKNLLIRKVSYTIIACEIIAIVLLPFSKVWHIALLAEGLSFISFHIWVIMATFES